MNLGEHIYKHRTRKALSQTQLSEALGVSRQSISKWENNSAVPELDKLVKMCEIFEISLDELVFDRTPTPQKEQPDPVNIPAISFPPMRVVIGLILLLVGMIFFLFSIY